MVTLVKGGPQDPERNHTRENGVRFSVSDGHQVTGRAGVSRRDYALSDDVPACNVGGPFQYIVTIPNNSIFELAKKDALLRTKYQTVDIVL